MVSFLTFLQLTKRLFEVSIRLISTVLIAARAAGYLTEPAV